MCPADTSPEAWEVFLDIQRRMSPREKMAMSLQLTKEARQLAEDVLRRNHPGADEHEILLRYARTTLGDELFRRVYGDVLPVDPPGLAEFDLEALSDEVFRQEVHRLIARELHGGPGT